MEALYILALAVHIISGFGALVSGLVAILSRKGQKTHGAWGRYFFLSMVAVCGSAVLITFIKSNTFLFHIGVFSFFMVFSGYRAIKNKCLKPHVVDWMVVVIGLFNGLAMVWSAKLVLMIFGMIGSYLALADVRLYYRVLNHKEVSKTQWLVRHIGMMLGTYIAASTAFIVVNITVPQYPWLPWLVPTFIGTPLIVYWTIRHTQVLATIATVIAVFSMAEAQPYIEEGQTRHRFAQLNIGAEQRVFMGSQATSHAIQPKPSALPKQPPSVPA